MEYSFSQRFSLLSKELCIALRDLTRYYLHVDELLDQLNALPYKTGTIVVKADASPLIDTICLKIQPTDQNLSPKASLLLKNLIKYQNIDFSVDFLSKVILWLIESFKTCHESNKYEILENVQDVLQKNFHVAIKYSELFIGEQGIYVEILDIDKSLEGSKNDFEYGGHLMYPHKYYENSLLSLKGILSLITIIEDLKLNTHQYAPGCKENITQVITKFLMMDKMMLYYEFLYCKVLIAAFRVLSHIFFHDLSICGSLPELIGICRHFILYGLTGQITKPERIMPSQQTIASEIIKITSKGGKKQKLRKPRNKAKDILKKEIPVSDHSLMLDICDFENNSAYKPISKNFLQVHRQGKSWTLNSDSELSDVENGAEAKMIALKSRVRQSAANFFLVLLKVKEKKEIFGYWWALLPSCPDVDNWNTDQNAKMTLAYCAVTDLIANGRVNALSIILALLSGSKLYLAQAEICKKDTASFIPFSVSLGYMITCMHKILIDILNNERNHPALLCALKCCAALVQVTPYHRMQEGLISDLVLTVKRFLFNKDVSFQVGALITFGCIVSVEPKVDEVLMAIQSDILPDAMADSSNSKEGKPDNEECDDFEEGYSDDEMSVVVNITPKIAEKCVTEWNSKYRTGRYFNSWILDICFKNIGWLFKGNESFRCNPAAVPVMLESLQVISAIAYHYLSDLLKAHVILLADVLCDLLQQGHHDLVLQAAKLVSVVADGILKLEEIDQAPPLQQCMYMWEKLLTPLSTILQGHENPSAKAIACDCIANIGEKSFQELPRQKQMFCCALLMGSCSDEEPVVRAAAVRALAMAVMFRTLREDIGFVSDCGENILRALAEPTLVVRLKGAWALGNLSDALVLNMEQPELEVEGIDDELLMRLLEVSVKCSSDNDKVKMSATRAFGNLLRLINKEILHRNPKMKNLCEMAISKLLHCACQVNNMKVRWNACYALGNAMKNVYLFDYFNEWKNKVIQSLCAVARDCKNLKVRINAAAALRSCSTRANIGNHMPAIWRDLMAAMDSAANLDDFTEYKHKDNLVEQLCVTLAHFCCLLEPSDLADIQDPLIFHGECAKSLYSQVYQKLPPENASCLKILQAAKFVTMDLIPENDTQTQALGTLQDIFILDM
ncbi:HEAT repeat-containing protein 6 [Battus philenor]|uniref:HEAT repeat-containing protein 6 n=1 Tax=Battus philenor TaxID=42288 RepID=UPI0035CF5677